MKQLVMVLLSACGTSEPDLPGYAGLEPGNASGMFELQVHVSNANRAPFVAATTRVTGDPESDLEVEFVEASGERSLTFALIGPIETGVYFFGPGFALYRESESLQWVSPDPAEFLSGGLKIEASDHDGFTFSLEHILHPGTADATDVIIFSGRGDVAFP